MLLAVFVVAAVLARDPHAGLRRDLSPDLTLFERLRGTTYTTKLATARGRVTRALDAPRDEALARTVLEALAAAPEAEDRLWAVTLVRGVQRPWAHALALGALGDVDETVVSEAQQVLVQARPLPLEALARSMESPSPQVRSRALGVAGHLGADGAALSDAVRGRLDDEVVEVRWEASVTWARIHPGEDVSDELLPRLERERRPGGHVMVESTLLYALMHQPAVEALLPLYDEALRSSDPRELGTVLARLEELGPRAHGLRARVVDLGTRPACADEGAPCAPPVLARVLAALDAAPP